MLRGTDTPNRPLFLIGYFGHGVNDMYWFILPIVLPLMLDRFSLQYTDAGAILTSYLLVIAVLSFILGNLADSISRPVIVGVGFLLSAFSLLGAGFARSPVILIPFLLLTAAGVSTFHPAIYATIHEGTQNRRGWAFGSFEFFGMTSMFVLSLLAGTLFDSIGWQGVIVVISIPGFLMAWLFLSSRSRFEGSQSSKAIRESTARKDPASPDRRNGKRLFLLVILSNMVIFLTLTAVMNFMPTYLVRSSGLSPTLASYTSSLYFFGAMIAAPLAGLFMDRRSPLLTFFFSSLLYGPMVFLLSLPLPNWAIPLVLVPLGGCMGAFLPSRNAVFAQFGAGMGMGRVFGISMGVSTITNSISPILFGLLADHLGLRVTMRLFSIPAAIGCFISVYLAVASRRRDMSRMKSTSQKGDSK